jgi:hypothetical protein
MLQNLSVVEQAEYVVARLLSIDESKVMTVDELAKLDPSPEDLLEVVSQMVERFVATTRRRGPLDR